MKILLLLLTLCGLGCSMSDPAGDEPDPAPVGEFTGLKTVAPYPVGVALQARHLTSTPHTQRVERVFSSITAEYEMKMEPLSTGPGAYAWAAADALVDYAAAHGLQVHGHTLVWHQTTPAWSKTSPATMPPSKRSYATILRRSCSDTEGRW